MTRFQSVLRETSLGGNSGFENSASWRFSSSFNSPFTLGGQNGFASTASASLGAESGSGWLSSLKTGADYAGYLPVLNIPASVLGAGISAYEGDYWAAGSGLLNVIPGMKYGRAAYKGISSGLRAWRSGASNSFANKISGYTDHGLNQAIGRDGGRGVSATKMLDAVRYPQRVFQRSDGAMVNQGQGASVILNSERKIITTYGKSRGPQIWPSGTTRPSGSGPAQRRANELGFSYNPQVIR